MPTPHAFNVFVRSDINASVNANTYVKIGEPTYQRKNFADDGPGSGHIIKVNSTVFGAQIHAHLVLRYHG